MSLVAGPRPVAKIARLILGVNLLDSLAGGEPRGLLITEVVVRVDAQASRVEGIDGNLSRSQKLAVFLTSSSVTAPKSEIGKELENQITFLRPGMPSK